MKTIRKNQWKYKPSWGFDNKVILGIKKSIYFLTTYRIILSLNGMLLYCLTSLLYGFEPNPILLEAAFMVTFAVYTLNIVTDKLEDNKNRKGFDTGKKPFLAFSIFGIIMALYLSFLLGIKAITIISIPLITGFIYSVKIIPQIPRIKEIFALKSIIVATSWALTGTFLPYVLIDIKFEPMILVFMYIFIQIFIGTILGDIIDIKGDLNSGITTIPVFLGKKKTKILLYGINSIILPMLLYSFVNKIFIEHNIIFSFGYIYGYIMIWFFTKKNRHRIMYETLIDGMWVPQLLIFLLIH